MLKIEPNVFMTAVCKRDWQREVLFIFQRTEIWRISDCVQGPWLLNGFHFNKISNLTYSKQLWLTYNKLHQNDH